MDSVLTVECPREGVIQYSGRPGSALVTSSRVADLTARLAAVGEAAFGSYHWQRTRDPYLVFVAEYFLRRSNRTTVERFLPRFIERFPNAESLVGTDPEVVVAEARWAGMRTRTMKLPAAVASFLALEWPTVAALEQIPHVGPYAARAVALYACGQSEFPVDGNVSRVLLRFLGLVDDDQLELAARAIATEAEELGGCNTIKQVHFGALTVGWRTCRTRRRCGDCPLKPACLGVRGIAIREHP